MRPSRASLVTLIPPWGLTPNSQGRVCRKLCTLSLISPACRHDTQQKDQALNSEAFLPCKEDTVAFVNCIMCFAGKKVGGTCRIQVFRIKVNADTMLAIGGAVPDTMQDLSLGDIAACCKVPRLFSATGVC